MWGFQYRLIFNDLTSCVRCEGRSFCAVGCRSAGLALFTAIQVTSRSPGRTFFDVYYIPVIMALLVSPCSGNSSTTRHRPVHIILDAFGVSAAIPGDLISALMPDYHLQLEGLRLLYDDLYQATGYTTECMNPPPLTRNAHRVLLYHLPMLQNQNCLYGDRQHHIIVKSFVPACHDRRRPLALATTLALCLENPSARCRWPCRRCGHGSVPGSHGDYDSAAPGGRPGQYKVRGKIMKQVSGFKDFLLFC